MISKPEPTTWQPLSIAIVGGGIGGLAASISLRRAGHAVTIYERADFAGEVGASISCAANGTRWLHEWGVNVEMGDPVILRKLINRDWETGEAMNVFDLGDYEEKWGHVSIYQLESTLKVDQHVADEHCVYCIGLQYVSPTVYACHVDGKRRRRGRRRNTGQADCQPQGELLALAMLLFYHKSIPSNGLQRRKLEEGMTNRRFPVRQH